MISLRKVIRGALVTVALLFPAVATAQGAINAQVRVSVSPDTVTVGQPFTVSVRVQAPAAAVVRFPAVPDSGDAIEAVDPRTVTETPGAAIDRTAVYRVVAWDLGDRRVALAPVMIALGGVEQRFELTVPTVHVRTLLPADSADRIAKPARDPLDTPSGLWKLWLLLAALAAVLFGWYWNRRNAPKPPPAEREAFVVASTAFEALDRMALHEAGEPARHVIAHIDVMREYLGRRFPAAHQAQTPAEFARVLETDEFPARHDRLVALLSRDADLRFASTALTPDEAAELATAAKRIVGSVQEAHEARLRAADRGPQRPRRR